MKTILAFALAALATAASAQPNVGVSVHINQPGIYGRINIGDVPRPALVMAEPVLIAPGRVVYERQPIYLYVPPAHQQNWRRYCGRYNACGQPVYFVRDDWVRERYEHEHPGWDRGRHRGWEHQAEHREERRDDRRDERRGDHRDGRDEGHGHDGRHDRRD
jgi:hypothetical protein